MQDLLYDCWGHLGAGFNVEKRPRRIDIEYLIVDTISNISHDPRLLLATIRWFIGYSDLINTGKLKRLLPKTNSSILGACIEHALQNGGDVKLKNVLKGCEIKKEKKILFEEAYKGLKNKRKELYRKHDSIFFKWGYYINEVNPRIELLEPRQNVLKNIRELAIRAFIGVNIRADILTFILLEGKAYIKEISKKMNYTYVALFNETKQMVRDNILKQEKYGHLTIVSLNQHYRDILLRV